MKSDCSTLRPELVEKINAWLISFYHLDPRYKILTFFNKVAEDGADNMVDDGSEDEEVSDMFNIRDSRTDSILEKMEILKKFAFNTTSILTVWRPCSNDAMKKMMEGIGVGKGLDIKGKSAKKGLLSAFVPFLQIHEEKDKKLVQEIPIEANLRAYYWSSEARQEVIESLESLVGKLSEDYNDILTKVDEEYVRKIKTLDKYKKKGWYGLEVSQRLFWKGYVTDQDITRGEDTETGRPSMPGFQDANLKTLKVACMNKPSPMPVLIQYDPKKSMSAQHLVMAYEENGTVTPVVSDFDGFLLGWRREALWFGCNLPREQEDLMMWCIHHIESILDDTENSTDSWTVRWLEVLKKEAKKGFHPEIPEYGFGDPKSYSIMEQAAIRLIDTGAVRHGSECFNYYFPQELDDYFLVISDTFSPVPWKYVDVDQLLAILSEKIAEGFVFPLNPKWILCDPGWKKLYDELMASKALYADLSKDVWFPPFSGVREKIDHICRKHPKGFQQEEKDVKYDPKKGYSPLRRNLKRGIALTGNAAFDLAELELENYKNRLGKGSLHAQIRRASMEEVPELDEDDEDADNNDHFLKKCGVSKRSFFKSSGTGKNTMTPDASEKTGGGDSISGDSSAGESGNGESGTGESGRRGMFASSHKGTKHLYDERRGLGSESHLGVSTPGSPPAKSNGKSASRKIKRSLFGSKKSSSKTPDSSEKKLGGSSDRRGMLASIKKDTKHLYDERRDFNRAEC